MANTRVKGKKSTGKKKEREEKGRWKGIEEIAGYRVAPLKPWLQKAA